MSYNILVEPFAVIGMVAIEEQHSGSTCMMTFFKLVKVINPFFLLSVIVHNAKP